MICLPIVIRMDIYRQDIQQIIFVGHIWKTTSEFPLRTKLTQDLPQNFQKITQVTRLQAWLNLLEVWWSAELHSL